jgi:hypothetical protein
LTDHADARHQDQHQQHQGADEHQRRQRCQVATGMRNTNRPNDQRRGDEGRLAVQEVFVAARS